MKRMFGFDGIRLTRAEFCEASISSLNSAWKKFVSDMEDYPNTFSGKGIVFCAGGLKYFTCCYIAICQLRRLGCTLPIEVWYLGNELSREAVQKLEELSVECKDFYDYDYDTLPLYKYNLKSLAIIKSAFKEVLFVDADNICVKDPTFLFSCPEYLDNGALFWPDYWKTSADNPIWRITESDQYQSQEQESGQLLIDKERCWQALNLCCFFNSNSKDYYKMLHGDKDTFRFAWFALKAPFHMIEKEPGACGQFDSRGNFAGNTIVQYAPDGSILFLHRNQIKWDVTLPGEMVWSVIKSFKPDATVKEYHLYDSYTGNTVMDIRGDIELSDCTAVFGELEEHCLADLDRLRATTFFDSFLRHSYLVSNRFANNIYFSLGS